MKTLEVVALTNDVPEKHLRRGQVGTIVELHAPFNREAPLISGIAIRPLKDYIRFA